MGLIRISLSGRGSQAVSAVRVTGPEQMMSTREIADITKKQHDNVLRDTREMLKKLDASDLMTTLNHLSFKVVHNERGQTAEILLNRELCYTLVTGYRVDLRRKVIRREALSWPLFLKVSRKLTV